MKISPATLNEIASEIIREIDRRTLLGAAYDCMSEKGQDRFKESLKTVVSDVLMRVP